ncbi:MAG TPA: crosslink repair DNA glycosylase YcaQ family protein [Candidatus Limnocylindria bacterium]|jgi:hypothetical protein|nr:crosslink repair DNA glycosylase YcaQ family protein [Candidatus Limnocylindria bacterium]
MSSPLQLSREQILAFRRATQALDQRLPAGGRSLKQAAWAGLQDSVPRSGLHSLHARVEGVRPDTWEDPALAQVWGPRYAAYVVPADAHAAFTLARMPERGALPARAEDLASRLKQHLAGRKMGYGDVGMAMGMNPNNLRYASLTGTVCIRWEGARQAAVWAVPRPHESAAEALEEMVRRYLHVFGPSTADSLARWAGVDAPRAGAAFESLAPELIAVRTPLGDAWLLAADEQLARAAARRTDAARLLPSGDPYFLLWHADRDLLVPDPKRRDMLWTTRVWPGALLLGGEIAGTWRRSKALVTVTPWRRLSAAERRRVEEETATLPLPDVAVPASVQWDAA